MAREMSTEGGSGVRLFRSVDFEDELLARFFRYQSPSSTVGDSIGGEDEYCDGREIFSKSSGVIGENEGMLYSDDKNE